ncbi:MULTISPECIES: transcription-repair coupling factor [Rhodanobacter]|uniref:transcription-repair coupling factor n=1 Tax=Rhodanobacter TaxID=75309 RepID=UPI00041F25F4|nr:MULTISPECIES: transcription-repair coupling factor [Rhodanobacter]KZC18889.1 transcription-repair coupling factor [Rhodanobacter denitrificans]UJM95604.1 transcription-repair coupling factor [Rhodanobacter denitrificans]UJM99134.1 transcription-repair coupling factor [Rhodanobacter denitrificans]UJN21983.1 transcription-repair coupling factor [Rhodanobacter denitrificans]
MPSPIKHPPLPTSPKQCRHWTPPHGSARALLLAEAARAHDGLLVVVARDTQRAQALEAELKIFAGGLPVLHFPDWETLPYDVFSPHPEIVSQRVATLYRLPSVKRGVLVVPVATLMQRIAPHSHITGSGLVLAKGQKLDLAGEQRRLEASGYRHVPQVAEPGDFAVRGALLDIFPMGTAEPYRIELFDDEVESIRSFDPETQRSQQPVDRVELLPAREFPLTEEAAKEFRGNLRERFPIDVRRCPLYQDMKEGVTPGGIEYYLPLFFQQTATLFDYLADDALFVLGEGAGEAADQFWAQTAERYDQRAHDIERPVLPPAELYLPPEQLRERLNKRLRVEVVEPGHEHAVDTGTQPAPELPLNRKGEEPGTSLRHFLASYPGRVLIAADSAGRREALVETLAGAGMKPDNVDGWTSFLAEDAQRFAITIASLEQGFALTKPAITVLTERELYGERVRSERERKRRRGTARDPEAIIRDLTELTPGAPIVHVDHGVGRYQGLVSMDVGGMDGEFLTIEYARGDKLYVPVAQLGLVSRYSGTAPELAPLHSLGGDAWERARRKAAEKVRDVAAELLAIYAQRQARGGESLPIDRQLVEEFGSSFPFEETPDQESAIEAVLDDLAAPRAMDRVICGDVGFGKTEVALRAAFATATAGRQVAVLVPTTLLAQQHYRNFADRFADWPVRVDVLSRFKSAKEVNEALKRLADGQIDVIVGTHKLLQPDVKFKNLGLVIVDEEQRFGVRQKEQLKKLRAEVDLLTMTATPIPRTLNMAMAGLRDLSLIATPPAHRTAVRTFISAWDPATIREALQRELSRGGQVYFLHNEVQSIERTVRELEELVPDARIRIAHGQMPERELEGVMADFHRQRFNVLVCTTIIETGIDIPTANTIIIDRADRFGLAQLHQLRGRVGRSHHRAYAYLVVPDRRSITADAQKRLEALASLEELGAGFTLATHDLEIRGAGELLGDEQSGQIQEIGFGLYTELLDRAVRALKSGKVPDFDLSSEHETEVELHLPALIPDDYLPDVHHRLTLYKRIASARSEDELRDLQVEMIDRFGLLPEPTRQLFAVASLKLMATPLGIRKLDFGANGGRIVFREKPEVNPMTIIQLIQRQPRVYKLDGQDKLKVILELPGASERIRSAQELLVMLGARRPA